MKHKKNVLSSVKEAALSHRLLSAGTILSATGEVLATLLPPLLLARIVDDLASGLAITKATILYYFASLILQGLLAAMKETLLVTFGQKMTHALRSDMSEKLSRLPARTLSEENPGEVTARFLQDVDTVEDLFSSGIISMAADACRILSILSVITFQNTGLALLLLILLPLFALYTRCVQRRTLSAQLDNRRAIAAVSGLVPETIHNIRTIHLLGLTSYMEKRYNRRIESSYTAMERSNFYDAIYSPIVLMLEAAVIALVMVLSASGKADLLALFGMSVGTSVAIMDYILRIFTPIENLGMEIQTIQSAIAGVTRIDAFLAEEERSQEKHVDGRARGSILFSHVTFRYAKDQPAVLEDFSLSVKEGEEVTLVGRTGAGKSTLFKLLLGLYQPEKGTITIGGQDISLMTDAQRRRQIGCVLQHFDKIPGSILSQITLDDPAITKGMAKHAIDLAGLTETIDALPQGWHTLAEDHLFSQGEWQLLSIARAIAADPAVLLLDEITASLDAETEEHVLSALRRATKGHTVLSISHRVYEKRGRVVEIGGPGTDSGYTCSENASCHF